MTMTPNPFPPTSAHLFTVDEHMRIAACTERLRQLPALPLALPVPPTDPSGAPVHDRPALAAHVVALESATSLAERLTRAQNRLDELCALARDASRADPVGAGSYVGGEVARILATVPGFLDVDPTTSTPLYASYTAWADAKEAFLDSEVDPLTARIRQGYRA